jgi:glutathione peroxidase
MSATIPILDIPVEKIDGAPASLAEHRGKVLLIVNVASQCGFTPQYGPLEALYAEKREQGLVVCGFPANEFAGQEPGSNQDIHSFCETNFGVSFPMYAKIAVAGETRHPLYNALVESAHETTGNTTELRKHLIEFGVTPTSPPEVLWNFEKFLVGRDGQVVQRFAPDVAPDDAVLRKAIDTEIDRVV